jgi:ketosteroid isomerase-like protein
MIEHVLRPLGAALIAVVLAGGQSTAQSTDPAQGDIRAALLKWTADFNARNSRDICDLFAPDLRYDYRGQPERGYQDICELLQRSLRDPDKRYSYSPAIKEIIVAGDLAVVRLTWTLKIVGKGAPGESSSEETGLDVFRKQPDGSWKIIRYIAYEGS